MVRLFIFLLVVLGLGWSFAWLADRPGLLSITWQDHLIETSLMVAATMVVALIGAVMLLWWVIGIIWTSPYSVRRYFRARKRDRGYQALSTGLIAAGAGNALLARKMSIRTRNLLSADQEPLIHLLDAQAALIEGKYDDARAKFESMSNDPETRELGLRGLYMEARRLGANEAARQYAEKAVEHAPYLPWASQATLESQSQSGRWDEALETLAQQRAANIISRSEADRLRAVLLTARAGERLESDPSGAREDSTDALKLAKDLVPAAIICAKALLRQENIKKAASVLEGVWKLSPHPDIARTYIRARSGDSTLDRLKRAEKLEAMRPNNIESLLAVSQAALDAQDFAKARARAEAAARVEPSERVYLLLADIEEAETGDQGRIRHWMQQALRASRNAAWVADGFVSENWLPVSPVTGKLDAFEWKVPFSQLEGPLVEGKVAADEAIAALPPVIVNERPPVETTRQNASAEPTIVIEKKPAKPAAEPAVAAKTTEPEKVIPAPAKTQENDAEPVPFFGRPPDDPGVKDQNADPTKTRLRLF
ncbi:MULTISPECIES: heme biosynthesis protein HemY [Rhizobiaceae]|uniref:HemY protein n=1 Tax=Aliirhizobium cellulosilyticum TaxID=393664 RepID=A0A7W6XBU0_9HYPH|nr:MULTISPECIES: heme biosynthesis protein HemY [Rhizobium/Agrobacterium group]MBB4350941.1 HemY protein [Rhizobium cellulosilyticum]MBB4414072.1 HemY protein [Rhizobium cellulosilyticum]MBB4448687.1 HemY protein [Rhizobium cellulosilyticum]MBO0144446.1 heme biosynthesis protein HemY [Agrobacterium sp. Ap1]